MSACAARLLTRPGNPVYVDNSTTQCHENQPFSFIKTGFLVKLTRTPPTRDVLPTAQNETDSATIGALRCKLAGRILRSGHYSERYLFSINSFGVHQIDVETTLPNSRCHSGYGPIYRKDTLSVRGPVWAAATHRGDAGQRTQR